MKGILKIILVTLNLFFLSRGLQCSGDTPLYQNLNGVESCVKQCDGSLVQFTADNTCKDKSVCTLFLTRDQKCTSSCGTDYVALTLQTVGPYKACSNQCASYMYKYTRNSNIYCNYECPEDYLTRLPQNDCLANVNDCDKFISFDSNVCKDECNEFSRGIPVVQNGLNICQYCIDFLIPSTPSTKASCVKTCPTGQVGFMQDGKCYQLSTAATFGCKDMKISSDQKTCDQYCPFGDIMNINGDCVAQCTTPNCSNCPDGQVLKYRVNQLSCILTEQCAMNISSDGKKCLYDCSKIGEEKKSNKCSKCEGGTVFYYSTNGDYSCKNPGELTDEEKDTSIQLTRALQNNELSNYEDVQFFSNKVNQEILKHYQALTSSSNIKATFQIIEGYLKLMSQQIQYDLTRAILQKFGSSSTIMSFFQFVAYGKQVNTSINMKSLLEGSLTDLTEQKNKQEKDTASSVTVQIIASNPACKTKDCEKYPIIQAQTQESLGSGRRMLASTRTFTVEFTVTEASSKYICLNYNLETSEVIYPYSLPIVSNNGLTMTCEAQGAMQLFLDSSCDFISRSDCNPSPAQTQSTQSSTPTQKDSGSSGINTGGIIGIVIGALAGTVLFSVGGFMLYKKFTKIKVANFDVKQPQPVPNTELITEPNTDPITEP